jgi:hypothetical protein
VLEETEESPMRPVLLFAPAFACALFVLSSGCDNKIAECNKLIGVLNAEGAKIKPGGSDAAALKKMADDLEASAKAIGDVEVKIPELTKFRDDAKRVYVDIAGASRAAAKAIDDKDLTKMTSTMKSVSDSAQANSKLVGDINKFCSGQ